MQANVGRVTSPERVLRSALRSEGLAFSTDVRPIRQLRCKVDILLRRQRLCIFIDGCFWHACPKHCSAPKLNRSWWAEKLQANVERDKRQRSILRVNGWHVIRVWEHELVECDRVVHRILRAVRPSASTSARLPGASGERSEPTRARRRGRT